ncbi:uncharacterized protein LOC143898528 isoform X4 [Temnothorax americanus]|uniref:uncharacterized protein LOC143898528 isoform X4 n=1 Tax=Temnothorax americanus TaxID=1964332 RepID=UPI0040695A9E
MIVPPPCCRHYLAHGVSTFSQRNQCSLLKKSKLFHCHISEPAGPFLNMCESSNLNLISAPLSKADEIQYLKFQTRIVEEKLKNLQEKYNSDFATFEKMVCEIHLMKQELYVGKRLLKVLSYKGVYKES